MSVAGCVLMWLSPCAELAAMATKILALVTAYDETTANEEAMAGAAMQFDDLLQVRVSL